MGPRNTLGISLEDVSLVFGSHASSNGVSIKIPYGIDVYLHRLEPWIIRSSEADLGRWALTVAGISVDAYRCLAFIDITCHFRVVIWVSFVTTDKFSMKIIFHGNALTICLSYFTTFSDLMKWLYNQNYVNHITLL